jgi:hypothetical protein
MMFPDIFFYCPDLIVKNVNLDKIFFVLSLSFIIIISFTRFISFIHTCMHRNMNTKLNKLSDILRKKQDKMYTVLLECNKSNSHKIFRRGAEYFR